MNQTKSPYHGYRFPPQIISHAVWLYHTFWLSYRDVEYVLAELVIDVSYESIRSWCNKFGPAYARSIRNRGGSLGDTWMSSGDGPLGPGFLFLSDEYRSRYFCFLRMS